MAIIKRTVMTVVKPSEDESAGAEAKDEGVFIPFIGFGWWLMSPSF